MKIQFGTTSPGVSYRPMFLAFSGTWLLLYSHMLLKPSNKCHESGVHSPTSNLTPSTEDQSSCRLHYEKCLCSVLSNKTDNSADCITNIQLQCSRILLLVIFVFQICVIQELFTLSGDFNRKLIYIAWFASLFTFIGLAIGIYWDGCYQFHINSALAIPWLPLGLLAVHNHFRTRDREEALKHDRFCRYICRLERNRNEVKSWQELL